MRQPISSIKRYTISQFRSHFKRENPNITNHEIALKVIPISDYYKSLGYHRILEELAKLDEESKV